MYDWEVVRSDCGQMVWAAIARILRNQVDVEDCYQEVFLEAFRRANARPVENMPGFLRWLAVRRALDTVRKRDGTGLIANVDPSSLIDSASDDRARCSDLLESLRYELSQLPETQAEAFWLCCIEDRSYAETGETLGIAASHVGTLVYRTRQHLRKKLDATNNRIIH
ncbi:MAG: sigma-70 family RNA polymerase sigma factor [Planctomycetales bacterium]|nr:sigma-70 family RNA polymerase sigma factor [Planctomycetales bacterium]